MQSIRDIMQIWPSIAEMSRELQINEQTLYTMRRRRRISPDYWPKLIEGARRRGHMEVSPELLMQLNTYARERKNTQNEKLEVLPDGEIGPIARGGNDKAAVKRGHIESTMGHFSRFRARREARFVSLEQIDEHIAALRDEWER